MDFVYYLGEVTSE